MHIPATFQDCIATDLALNGAKFNEIQENAMRFKKMHAKKSKYLNKNFFFEMCCHCNHCVSEFSGRSIIF